MALQVREHLFGRQGSIWIDKRIQPVIVAVQPVSARRLWGKMEKFVEERFARIHYNSRKGLSSSFESRGPSLTRIALNEQESPSSNYLRVPSNVTQESYHGSPRQGFLCGKDLSTGSACRNGGMKGRLQCHVGTGHSARSTSPQETNKLPKDNNGEKDSVPTTNARKLKSHNLQIEGGGGNIHMPSGCTLSEAVSILKNRQQQGIFIDSYMFVEVLKRCLKHKDLLSARQVHECLVHTGMDKNPYVANNLLNVFIRCGRFQDARLLFDGLEKKTAVTWSIMIAGYANNGHAQDALELFNQMCEGGAQPDEITCLSILKACATPLALEWGKEVHAYIRQAGYELDVRVGTALVQMYAKSACITEARQVFEKLGANRDVVTWNVMIGAYAQSGFGAEAYRLFLQMQREGFIPNAMTYVSVLNASASAGALEWVKEVHTHALKAGLESDLRVCNVLVHMYAKSGSIEHARLIFDRLTTRDVITWTMMIGAYAEIGSRVEAYQLFLQMHEEGFKPNAITYVSILNTNAGAGPLEWVKEVHRHAREAGLESDLRVGNALVHMYAKSGSIDDARAIFDMLKTRDVVTWNMMVDAYAESGCGPEAYGLFLQMQREGFVPDATTYVSILNASASAGALEWVKEVHSHALKAGLESDLRVGNALIHMYAKSGSIDDARLIFDSLKTRDVFTWNVMIGAYSESGLGVEAYRHFLRMQQEGFIPNAITYVSILNTSASKDALKWVKEVHRHALNGGLESDLRVGTGFVQMYSKCGSIDDARLIFQRMEKRDVVTWTVMIDGLAQHGRGEQALELFRKMNADGVKPDGTTFVALLSACCHAGLVDDGRRLFSTMTQDYGIEPTILHYNCMVDLLGRAGHLEEAKDFIDDMPVKPDGVIWGALLGACKNYNNVELGKLAAKELLKLEPKDASAYVLLSNIYSGASNWDKASLVRKRMQKSGIRKEPGRSWIEVDGKIHNFVAGDTSHPEAKAIYTKLNKLIEKLKAEGYVPDTQLVLHNVDDKDKELVLCSHSEKLAIAYGLMRTPSGNPIRIFKNLRVCTDCHTATKFISKVTGRVIIARDANRFHHFKDGLCSCGDYW